MTTPYPPPEPLSLGEARDALDEAIDSLHAIKEAIDAKMDRSDPDPPDYVPGGVSVSGHVRWHRHDSQSAPPLRGNTLALALATEQAERDGEDVRVAPSIMRQILAELSDEADEADEWNRETNAALDSLRSRAEGAESELAEAKESADDAAVLLENERLQHEETKGYRQHAERGSAEAKATVAAWQPVVREACAERDAELRSKVASLPISIRAAVDALPVEQRPK